MLSGGKPNCFPANPLTHIVGSNFVHNVMSEAGEAQDANLPLRGASHYLACAGDSFVILSL